MRCTIADLEEQEQNFKLVSQDWSADLKQRIRFEGQDAFDESKSFPQSDVISITHFMCEWNKENLAKMTAKVRKSL